MPLKDINTNQFILRIPLFPRAVPSRLIDVLLGLGEPRLFETLRATASVAMW